MCRVCDTPLCFITPDARGETAGDADGPWRLCDQRGLPVPARKWRQVGVLTARLGRGVGSLVPCACRWGRNTTEEEAGVLSDAWTRKFEKNEARPLDAHRS